MIISITVAAAQELSSIHHVITYNNFTDYDENMCLIWWIYLQIKYGK